MQIMCQQAATVEKQEPTGIQWLLKKSISNTYCQKVTKIVTIYLFLQD